MRTALSISQDSYLQNPEFAKNKYEQLVTFTEHSIEETFDRKCLWQLFSLKIFGYLSLNDRNMAYLAIAEMSYQTNNPFKPWQVFKKFFPK